MLDERLQKSEKKHNFMERINIWEHTHDPKYYNKDRDIEVALAWNAVKKILTEKNRDELFEYIKSVRLTEKNIVITTEKPLINWEIRFYQEDILSRFNTSILNFSKHQKKSIRLQ